MKTVVSKVVVLLCCGAVIVGCGKKPSVPGENASTSTNVVVLEEASFDAQVAKGVVLVDFWAPWCGPCRMQGPIVEQVADQLHGKAVVAKLNVDNAPTVSEKFDIRGIPSLIVFKDGKLVQQFVGVTDAETLVSAVNTALATPK